MTELLLFLLIFFSGFYLGRMTLAWKLRHLLLKELTSKDLLLNSGTLHNEIIVDTLFIEQSNNTLYLYDCAANTFICQGNSIDELASLSHKYKNIKHAVVQYGDEMLAFGNGKVTYINKV